jgi:predicted phosphodiesterase
MRRCRRSLVAALLAVAVPSPASAQQTIGPAHVLKMPNKPGSLKFAVIGDSGQPGGGQTAIAKQMTDWRARYPYEFVIMTGDNLYGRERPRDYEKKFSIPYKPLIDAGVKFYASLGNHDDDGQTQYKLFNMNGSKYYSFKPKNGVRFFALDSNYVDARQLEWLGKELSASGSDWKIAFFHHPLYSSGEKHGSNTALREQVEPLLVKHGVDVVFTGHEHFYERLKPQKGITYFISGNAAKLRKGNIGESAMTAKGFDQGYAFMLVEIAGDEMHFQTLDADGKTVDGGIVRRREATTTSRR